MIKRSRNGTQQVKRTWEQISLGRKHRLERKEQMRKVIFVGSAPFSGSTLLAMILGNDARGFTCGEAQNFLLPTKQFHPTLDCGCGDQECGLWPRLRKLGPEKLYETVFRTFPHTEFIVDSSKNPFWIQAQSEYLKKRGIETRNILIWKSPLEIAHSFQKRGRYQEWERSWVNYHRLYFAIIRDWRAIHYKDLVSDNAKLGAVCQYLDIPYFPQKDHYWEKIHHVIGGNYSAKIHLHHEGSPDFADAIKRDRSIIAEDVQTRFRTIYYEPVTDPVVTARVDQRVRRSNHIRRLTELFEAYDLEQGVISGREWSAVSFSPVSVGLRKIKQAAKVILGTFRYGSWRRGRMIPIRSGGQIKGLKAK